jgi:hypothetical protein
MVDDERLMMKERPPAHTGTSVTTSSIFIYPAIYSWDFTVTSVTSVTLPLNPLSKPVHQMLHDPKIQQTVTNCNNLFSRTSPLANSSPTGSKFGVFHCTGKPLAI